VSNTVAESLRIANGQLRDALARLQTDANAPWLLNPGELSDLLAIVSHAASCRRGLASDLVPAAELENEICEYRNNLEKLAQVLPSLQGSVLAEKARVQNAQSHVAATNAWVQASRSTF
jgi:hypothetical protein